jgi:hypothetical protein
VPSGKRKKKSVVPFIAGGVGVAALAFIVLKPDPEPTTGDITVRFPN